MKLSSKDLKAINWYAQQYQLKPQLSTPPTMYFTKRDSGETLKIDLAGIVLEYSAANEEDKKTRAREKRIAHAGKKLIR